MSRDDVPARPGRVLVTDGEFKHTLGIVRSLARRGHEVHLLAASRRAPAVHSRAVTAWHPAPPSSAPGFDAALLDAAARLAPASLIAVGSGAMAALDRLRDRLPATVRHAIAPADSFRIANDKRATAALARRLGLRTPEEREVRSEEEAVAAWRALGGPLVLKSAREEGRKVLRYVREEGGLAAAYRAVSRRAAGGEVIAQSYVPGDGWGYSALYWHGERRRAFIHRRIREWPPSGGTSACAESVPHAPGIERAGAALLDALAWHGVAMVELKGAGMGEPAVIEINAKFWGSLDIALAAGVDFPGDLAACLEGRPLGPAPRVRHLRFTWPLGGDLWHGLARPSSLGAVLWDAIAPGVARSFRWSDPLPHLWEAWQWARATPGAFREHRNLR